MVAEESRDFLKVLRNRPRIRGVAYFAPPSHVEAAFAEFRQLPGNQSKWRQPAARGPWGSFWESPGGLAIS